MKARCDDFDDEPGYDDHAFIADYGLPASIGTASTLGGDKPLPKGWAPPKREFPIGFHVAAPGPSHDDAPAEMPPKRRGARADKRPRPAAPRKPRAR